MRRKKKINFTLVILIGLIPLFLQAQYFGKNKPRYQTFDFKVLETPNFEIYHYLENDTLIKEMAQQSELWYQHHQSLLFDTIAFKNPIIFYNNHAQFQQTNTITSSVGVATGGVTEAFKNRVTMPLTFSNQKTFQVLGHELVHAFQFNMIINGDSTSLKNLGNLPLFVVEGLAEYMTIGRVDPHTAMWMRDAVLHDKIPELKKMAHPKYFPYRYGQAFWSFLTGVYGDEIIEPLFMNTAKYGLALAVDSTLNISLDNLSNQWQTALKTHYEPLLPSKKPQTIGRKLISDENAGLINISPSLSPDGKYVIFLSEKGIFTTDLYLADARKGTIIKKIASTIRDSDVDNLNFIESSGTWSPDSKEFAYVAFSKGKNKIIIVDAFTGKEKGSFFIEGVDAISNPAWSPDGKFLAFSGLVQGHADIYTYHLKSGKTQQLTNDYYSDIQPAWAPDSKSIVFSTDRVSLLKGRSYGKWHYNLATVDLQSKQIQNLDLFVGADNFNPNYDQEGRIWFLSDRDGYRNIYAYSTATDSLKQMTEVMTGISGITQYSPALSVSKKRERVLYTHYFNGNYTIYSAKADAFLEKPVGKDEVYFSAATLPVIGLKQIDKVNPKLYTLDMVDPVEEQSFEEKSYKPKFKLDYVSGGGGTGVGTGSFGTRSSLSGGVNLLFGDVLGNNQLFTAVSMNGELYDVGAALTYINKKNRIFWGASISHIPYLTGNSYYPALDTLQLGQGGGLPVLRLDTDLLRIFEDGLNVFAQFPFSISRRIEVGAGLSYRYFRLDRYSNYYDEYSYLVYQSKEKQEIGDGINLGSVYYQNKALSFVTNIAFVGDNSFFGIASPLQGYRYRIGVDKYFGEFDFWNAVVDFRYYKWVQPVSFAFKFLHYSRLGNDAERFYPIFIGDMGLVRGFGFANQTTLQERYNLTFNNLIGSKILNTSFEIRLPFTGPERLSLIKSNFLFTELALFVDGGVAFNKYDLLSLNSIPETPSSPAAVFSGGVSLRINLFGALIIEPYYAIPIRKNAKGGFGFNLIPGW